MGERGDVYSRSLDIVSVCVSHSLFSALMFEPPGAVPGEPEMRETFSGIVAVPLRHPFMYVRMFSRHGVGCHSQLFPAFVAGRVSLDFVGFLH